MRSMKRVFWSVFVGATLIFSATAYGARYADDVEDDMVPDVTARVSRISFIRGDVQIRREGSQDWEKAVLNLPIVEGDELATDAGGRLEIQLGAFSHIRLAENSYLKVVGLKDGSVALSLSEGTLNVRLTKFDKDAAFFEIDAPKTTVAIQRSGMYRIDAGKAGASGDVRVTVANDGEARVYADNSGFTLKNGRTATLKIDGPLAGEWETVDAARFADEFDTWTLDRDAVIARRIKDAYYDKYYDQDIYGAEDLNDNGEWISTKKYGYVWRPYASAISQYANWSPYRYGTWRWVPPYGWTWVNDEPWAWATYHHGRWFFDDGRWYWTPYGYTRRGRSWWYPALVGVTVVNQSIYWYPLPHDYGYFNYNYCFGGWGGPRGGHHGGNHGGPRGNHNGGNHNGGPVPPGPVAPGPGPTPPPATVGPLAGQLGPSIFENNDSRRIWMSTPPMLRVPPTGVVSTPLSTFGRDRTTSAAPPSGEIRAVLSKALGDNEQIRILPTYQELDGRVSTAIRVERPRAISNTPKPTGAAIRTVSDEPLDKTLRGTRVYGDRTPIRPEGEPGVDASSGPRKTGAVTRLPVQRESETPVRPERPVRVREDNNGGGDDPVRAEPTVRPTRTREERNVDPVRVEPTVRQTRTREERNNDPDPVRQPPPPRSVEPVRPQRNDPPPTRSEPTRSEPTRSTPPPRSESPKSDTGRSVVDRKAKDNR